MSEIVVVALFKVKPGHEEEASAALLEAGAQTHDEEGCLAYALHRAADDPTQLALIERWRSQEDLNEHFTKPYIAALGERAGEVLAEPAQVTFLTPLPGGDPAKGTLAGG